MILILGSGVMAQEIGKSLKNLGRNVLMTTTHVERVSHDILKYEAITDDLSDVAGALPIQLVINCAYSFRNPSVNNSINFSLVKYLKGNPFCKCVNISSMSAYLDAKSKYGRAKFQQEVFLLQHSIPSVRLGLPMAQPPVGLLALIKKLVNANPIFTIALSTPGSYTYVTPMAEFSEYIDKNYTQIHGVCSFVNPAPLDLVELTRMATKKPILRINWRVLFLLLRFVEFSGLKLRFGSDSVVGLVFSIKHPENNLYPSQTILTNS